MNTLCVLIMFIGVLLIAYGIVMYMKESGSAGEKARMLYDILFMNRVSRFNEDESLEGEIYRVVAKGLGEKRFTDWLALDDAAMNRPMIWRSVEQGLPSVNVNLIDLDDNDRKIIKKLIENVVKTQLKIYGLDDCVLTGWTMSLDLNMPCLQVRYATNATERERLIRYKHIIQERRLQKYKPVKEEKHE